MADLTSNLENGLDVPGKVDALVSWRRQLTGLCREGLLGRNQSKEDQPDRTCSRKHVLDSLSDALPRSRTQWFSRELEADNLWLVHSEAQEERTAFDMP